MPYAHVTALHRLVLIALFAALLAVGGWISIPIGPVPITLQTMFLTLAGLVLGPRARALAPGHCPVLSGRGGHVRSRNHASGLAYEYFPLPGSLDRGNSLFARRRTQALGGAGRPPLLGPAPPVSGISRPAYSISSVYY